MEKYVQHPLFKGVCGIFTFVFTWLTLDVSQPINYLLQALNVTTFEAAKDFLGFCVKLSICLFLGMLLIMVIMIVEFSMAKNRKKYTNLQIEREVYSICKSERRKKKKIEVVIWGYSLSFADPVQMMLKKSGFEEISVILCLPSEEYVKNKLIEDKTMDYRITTQRGRISDWTTLRDNGKIDLLEVYRFDAVPFHCGIKINNVMYVNYYKWNWNSSGKCSLIKAPYYGDARKFMRITKRREEVLFDNYCNRLDVLKEKLSIQK